MAQGSQYSEACKLEAVAKAEASGEVFKIGNVYIRALILTAQLILQDSNSYSKKLEVDQ